MINEELFNLFNSSYSKAELCRSLKIDTKHKSGKAINAILNKIMEDNEFKIDISAEGFKERRLNREKEKWELEKPTCKCCGKLLPFERRNKEFCNSSCSATYNNSNRKLSEETKQKISNSLLANKIKSGEREKYRTCAVCGKEFEVQRIRNGRLSRSKTCSEECHNKLHSLRSKESIKKIIEEGRFIGWQSRNITSYPEKFWEEVLKNNSIEYKREFYIKEFKYFLDFLIEVNGTKIDLEIDGKQHKYEDRVKKDIERDKNLKELGYIIYRIDWNEINTIKGSEKMKEKIDKFLEFYKNSPL